MMTTTVNRTRESLEQRSASAFVLTGVLILASLVVPVGLGTVTDWSWALGLVLIALAVVSVVAGFFGLYPRVSDRTPRLALAGMGAATVAGIAAVGMLALVGVAVVYGGDPGLTVVDPMRVFVLVGLLMAGGFSLGHLLFGVAIWLTESTSRTTGGLLIAGGGALLLPVVIESLGLISGGNTPPWLLFPVLGGLVLDTVAVGYSLRSQADVSEA